jgi:nitrogen regulatory protein P-II 1
MVSTTAILAGEERTRTERAGEGRALGSGGLLPGASSVDKAGPGVLRAMKMVEAIIRPYKLEEVRDALADLGVGGMTVSEVRGVGHQPEHTGHYAGAEYTIDLLPRVKIEVVVADDLVSSVISTVCRAARTGRTGDGKIFVLPLMGAIRIRTGETGHAAL